MSDIQPFEFEFEGEQVRFVGDPDKPECVAADMIVILYPEAERSSYNKYLGTVRTEWKDKKNILTPGGVQEMNTLKEPGIYALKRTVCRWHYKNG